MATSSYESEEILNQYLLFHYGSADEQMPWDFGPENGLNFPVRCVELLDLPAIPAEARALDIGCAVGRSSFELARHCREVIGIDFSHRFIAAAEALRHGPLAYSILESGTITTPATAQAPQGVDPARVQFQQGDACHLPADLGRFDVVIACNLLCRLPVPGQFLGYLADLLNPGGQFVITTPCTWMEDYTPQSEWIGATPQQGPTLEVLKQKLSPAFELQEVRELPFLIREHQRKYQWSVAQGSRWKRR